MADAQVLLPAAHSTVFDRIPTMPGVTESWTPVAWVAQINTPAVRFVSLSGGPDHPPGLAEPVVIKGRAPGAEAADEILVSEPAAADLGLHVGDEIILRLLLAREIARFSQGFGQPDGGFARVRVVGIARAPTWAEPPPTCSVTPAFARAARRRRLVPRRVRPAAVHGPGEPGRLRRGVWQPPMPPTPTTRRWTASCDPSRTSRPPASTRPCARHRWSCSRDWSCSASSSGWAGC